MSKWISVADRLPATWKRVLIFTPNMPHDQYIAVRKAVFSSSTGFDFEVEDSGTFIDLINFEVEDSGQVIDLKNITHWHDLPEQPKKLTFKVGDFAVYADESNDEQYVRILSYDDEHGCDYMVSNSPEGKWPAYEEELKKI